MLRHRILFGKIAIPFKVIACPADGKIKLGELRLIS
jgi:hypothetical protein